MSIRDLSTAELRAELARRASDDDFIQVSGLGSEESHVGRFYAVLCNGDFGDPLALFPTHEEADEWLESKQALDVDDDNWLDDDYCICRADAVLSIWNSVEADPLAPLPHNEVPFTIRTTDEVRAAVKAQKKVG